jgi:hypothetical protein
MDGADNGTVFTDSSSYAKTITPSGSVVTRTNVKQFGTASLRGEANGYLRFSPAITLSGDFTIAAWFSADDITSDQTLFGSTIGDVNIMRLNGYGAGSVRSLIFFGGSSVLIGSANNLSGISSGVFNYYALTRQGATLRDFLNGNLLSTTTFSGSVPIDTIGAGFEGTSNQFFGNIDEAIISNECLYTTSFTPPTQPF